MNAFNAIASALHDRGCRVVFGVPGGGPNLELIGALEHAGIRFALAHTESGAAMMASAHGLSAGSISAVVVTRGPGAANVVNGAAQATLDRAPLVVITDCVPASTRERVAHQRFEQRELMRPVALRTARIGDDVTRDELHDLLATAVGPPAGAVHIDLDSTSKTEIDPRPPAPNPSQLVTLDEIRQHIVMAERPVVISGTHSSDGIRGLLEAFNAPVLTTYQGVGVLPEGHSLQSGLFTNSSPERDLLALADLVILVGFDEVEPLPGEWPSDCQVIAVDPFPVVHRYAPVVAQFVGELGDVLGGLRSVWEYSPGRVERIRSRLADASRPLGPVDVVNTAAEIWPDFGSVTVDAGAHFLAVLPFWPVERRRQLYISNGLSTMGYALPAAIGIASADPTRPVLAFTGDGGLHMVLSELETLRRLGLPVCVAVFNDSELSLIRLKQRSHQGGTGAVSYGLTDFAAAATAMGVEATVVSRPDELSGSFSAALAAGGPFLIDVRLDATEYEHIMSVSRG
jgi:acetolactate synthase-1/2/3 large subunit